MQLRVINMSYDAYPNPDHPVEIELDAVAEDLDILFVTSAGNSGDSTGKAHGAWNGLSVGAVSRRAWWQVNQQDLNAGNDLDPFRSTTTGSTVVFGTSHGPFMTQAQYRQHPDLCALGGDHDFTGVPAPGTRQDISMAQADWGVTTTPLLPKSKSYIAAGTSMAAPQVSGAAALYFAERPNATAKEVKAAILASCDTSTLPIIPQATDTGTPNLFTSFENTFRSGFLRVDWLGDLCQRLPASQCLVTEVPFSGNTNTVTYTPAGAAVGTFFTAVAVWNRIDGDHTDLDLTVDCLNGTSTLKSFTTDRRSGIYEKLTFPLPTGTTQVRVNLTRHSGLSSLPVQLVVHPLPIPTTARPRLLAAASESYPQPAACATTLLDQRVQRTLPEWPETQTQSRISYAEAYGSGGWQRNFSSLPPGTVYMGPSLAGFQTQQSSSNKSDLYEMWFDENHFDGQGPFELRGLAFRLWRGGAHSRSATSTPAMNIEVAITPKPFMTGIRGLPVRISNLSRTYTNITAKGINSTSSVPMIVPRQADDWTLFFPFPEQGGGTHGWMAIPADMSGKGLYVKLHLTDDSASLRGLDWVADSMPNSWAASFGLRTWQWDPTLLPRPGYKIAAPDRMGHAFILGLLGGSTAPGIHPATLKLVGEPYTGGSFYLAAR